MRISGAKALKNIDRACVEELGIPMMVLMENAALKLFRHAEKIPGKYFVIAAGTGNNGGDALALARHLTVSGRRAGVFITGDVDRGSQCFKENYSIVRNMGLDIKIIKDAEGLRELKEELLKADAVVDGIFGTGLNKEVKGIHREIIQLINGVTPFTLCIDIPSGMDCDTGRVLGCCIRGNMTVTFQHYKKGFLSCGSGEYIGEVIVESIGIPENIENKYGENIFFTEGGYIRQNIKKRDKYSHKGSFGRTLIIGGSEGFYGAPEIASEAAVRCGSGLVTAAASKAVLEILRLKLKEAMTADTADERFEALLGNAGGIGVGPGMGKGRESAELLKKILNTAWCPVVIDADGLNILAAEPELMEELRKRAAEGRHFIFTPHPGEMARLTGKTIDYINENRLETAAEYAAENGIILLLKGFNTVITDGRTSYINPTGNSAMASGGMGDCLTGIIASLLSQGLEPLESAVCGAYIHGYAGERLSEKMHSLCASDINEYLPYALKEILSL